MRDIKKLFRRDCLYWLLMIAGMGVLLTCFLVPFIHGFMESVQWTLEIWVKHPELAKKLGDIHVIDIGSYEEGMVQIQMIQILMMGILVVALLTQTVKILFQETKNRAEVLSVFPVRTRSMLTYHYISGLLLIGLPILVTGVFVELYFRHLEKTMNIAIQGGWIFWSYAARTVLLFMLQYALLLFSEKVANHVPGTIFTFVIADYAMILLADYCLDINLLNVNDDCLKNWVIKAAISVVLIVLSYLADWKKDYARNGFYAFPTVHWIMMGSVFAELYFILHYSYDSIPKIISHVLTIVTSLLMTAGVHYLTKPKNI